MKEKIKKISAVLLSITIFFVVGASIIYAQAPTGSDSNPTPTGSDSNPSISIKFPNPFRGGDSLFSLLKTIINDIVLPIGGVVAVLAFIYSGFLYVTAQGNETKLSTAHKSLLYTAVGTAVLLGSWVLANTVCNTINQLGGPVCQ